MPQPLGDITYFGNEADTGLTVLYRMYDSSMALVAQEALIEAVPGIYTGPMPEAEPEVAYPPGYYLFRFFDNGSGDELSEPGVMYWTGKLSYGLERQQKLLNEIFGLVQGQDLSSLALLDVAVSSRATNSGVDSALLDNFAAVITAIDGLNNVELTAIRTQIDEALAAGGGGITPAEVRTEVDNALNAYDIPTTGEMDAQFLAIKGPGFDTATDSLEAIRDRGDFAWIGGTVVGDPGADPVVTGTQLAYDTITAAINEGALEVQYADKRVKYRALEDMKAIQRSLAVQLGHYKEARKYGQHKKNL